MAKGNPQRRSVFITGAGRRLGAWLAQEFARAGWNLILHAHRSKAELMDLAQSLRQQGTEVQTYFADLGDAAQLMKLVNTLDGLEDPIHACILNASNFLRKDFFHTTMEEWDEVLRVVLRAPVVLAMHIGKRMKMQGWGRLVFVGDSLGLVPYRGYAVHSLAKAALIPAMKILAEELAPEVTVNMVAPGAVLLPEDYGEEQRARAIARTVLKRLGTPQDVVAAVMFLVESAYITGAVIPVDGGRSTVNNQK